MTKPALIGLTIALGLSACQSREEAVDNYTKDSTPLEGGAETRITIDQAADVPANSAGEQTTANAIAE